MPIADGTNHLRLSDRWEIARPVADHEALIAWIKEKWPSLQDPLPTCLAALARALADLKGTDIAVSRVYSKEEASRNGYPKDEYDEAVVEVFVRLNRAGTPLTRDEITLSWIKHFWGAGDTQGDAKKHFEQLLEDLEERGIALEGLGEVAALLATFWACQPGGQTLTARDLLSAGKVQPMAAWLREKWADTAHALGGCARFLAEEGVAYGSEYNSLNAFAILAAWYFRVCQHDRAAGLNMQNNPRRALEEFGVRWIAATTWAGNWQARSGPVREAYANSLRDAEPSRLNDLMSHWLDATAAEGRASVAALGASDRSQVRQYLMALRIWNSLTPERQKEADLALRVGRGRDRTEVDHIVSVALARRLGDGLPDEDVNALGNCALLHKNFNIGKRDKPLATFLKDAKAPASFAPTFGIDDRLANPSNADDIAAAIKERGEKIKAEVAHYVWGAASAASA